MTKDDSKPDDSYERLKRAVMANPVARKAYEEARAEEMAAQAMEKIRKKEKKTPRRDG